MNTRLNIEKLDGNIVQKHGGSKQVGFKQLVPLAQRKLKVKQLEGKTNTDWLVNKHVYHGESVVAKRYKGDNNMVALGFALVIEEYIHELLTIRDAVSCEEDTWLNGLSAESGFELRLVAGIATYALMKVVPTLRLNIEKLDRNIVQKHGGSKQVRFKQLGLGVETRVHGVSNDDAAVVLGSVPEPFSSSASALLALRRLGSIFTSVYAAVQKLKKAFEEVDIRVYGSFGSFFLDVIKSLSLEYEHVAMNLTLLEQVHVVQRVHQTIQNIVVTQEVRMFPCFHSLHSLCIRKFTFFRRFHLRPSQPIPKTLNHQTSPRFNSRTHHSAMTNSNTPPPPPALTLVEKLYAVHNINSLVPEKLDLQESNYSTWSYFFKGHCSNFNVLNHIDGSTSTSDPPTDEWITADSIVKSWIFLTLSPTLRKRMISTNPASAKAAWDTIETIFQENKRTRTVALKGELRVIQMGDDTPDAYFSKIDSIITLLTDLGSTMDDDDIVTYAINGLSEKYGSLAQIIAHKDPFPDLATVRTMVTTEEMRLRSKQPILSTSTTSSSPQVLLATSQPRIQDNRNNRDRDARNENKTEICRNFGRGYCRWGTNCRFIHASPKGTNNPRPNSSQHNTRSMQQGPGHTGLNSASQQHLLSLIQAQQNLLAQYGLSISQGQQPVQHNNTMGLRPNAPPGFQQTQPHQPTFGFNGHQQALYSAAVQNQSASSGSTSQETQLPHAFNTLTLQDPANSNWNMDTGASSHLNSSVNNLSTIFNSRIYPSVLVGDGKSIPVTNTGHSTLPTPYRTLHLNNVLITPNIVKNLISVRQFVRENKCTIEFDEFGFSVKDFWTRQILLRCDSTGDLYPVTSPSYPQAFLVGQQTWHQRLGHPGSEVLRSLVSNNLISCNKTQSSVLCHACQLGKHVRLPFSLSETIVKAPFDIIHSDLWTSPLTSVSGIKYYVLFLDHFSHYLWVYPLRHKSDVLSKFIHFRAYVKNHFNCDIKSLQCDHGGEFDNTALHQLFVTNGISIRFSCPKTSQQNGKSERMIRTINNMIRTLLFQAHLPPTFWVEALHMAAYLLNILPSTAINNEIPHTRLFKTTPNYADLRVFGCLCYPHLHTNHKLEPRATPIIFLGYLTNHRGYRCLDLNTNKIILSHHVTFDETVFPYGSMTPHDSPSYTFLDT
ncbi:ribonuclease H-like domain-containing protein [Tanacetum coccineum]